MRLSTLFFTVLAGTASLVQALPAPESFTETELLLRADGDVSTLTARTLEESIPELVERDAAFAAATGADSLSSRGIPAFDGSEVEELVLRLFGVDDGLDLEERDGVEYADVLEARVGRAVAQVVKVAVKGIKKIIDVIKGKIEKDKAVSSLFNLSVLLG